MDRSEEIMENLKKFCQEKNIKLGMVSGIGATNEATVGLFDIATKKYHQKEMRGNFEIAHLYGNITTMNNELYLHIHINLGDKNQNSFAGHLNRAVVSATFEGIIEAWDNEVDREFSQEIGLNLLKF
jgi:predicted DNA-binding protein with PD1-like motif